MGGLQARSPGDGANAAKGATFSRSPTFVAIGIAAGGGGLLGCAVALICQQRLRRRSERAKRMASGGCPASNGRSTIGPPNRQRSI